MPAAETGLLPEAAVMDLYRATLEPDAWRRILAILVPMVGGTAGVHARLDRVHPRNSVFLVHGIDLKYLPAMARSDLAEDLIWRELLARPAGAVFRSTDAIPAAELQANSLYRRVALPAGMQFALLAVMENQPQLFANVGVTRADRDFSDAEVALMREALGHLRVVRELEDRLTLGDAGRRRALTWFDRTGQAIVVLDRAARSLHCNPLAQAILDSEDGVGLRQGQLWFGSNAVETEFRQALRLAMTAAPGDAASVPRVIRVLRRKTATPLALSVIACNSAADRALLPEGAAALLLIQDIGRPRILPGERLAWLYRLTPAEQRICEALYGTGSVTDAALRLGLADQTVRSHLKSIYAKFGVSSQAQLIRKLANALWMTSGHGTAVPAADP